MLPLPDTTMSPATLATAAMVGVGCPADLPLSAISSVAALAKDSDSDLSVDSPPPAQSRAEDSDADLRVDSPPPAQSRAEDSDSDLRVDSPRALSGLDAETALLSWRLAVMSVWFELLLLRRPVSHRRVLNEGIVEAEDLWEHRPNMDVSSACAARSLADTSERCVVELG